MHQHDPRPQHRTRPIQTKPLTLDSARVDELYGLEPVFDPAHPLPRRAKPKTTSEGEAGRAGRAGRTGRTGRAGRVSGVHPAGTGASLEADGDYDFGPDSESDSESEPPSMDAALSAFVDIQCPACWETQSVAVDLSAGPRTYIEDCQVCCHPLELTLVMDASGEFTGVTVARTE